MIIPSNMSEKTVAILGLSRSGMATASALAAGGVRVFAHDDNITPTMLPILPDNVIIAPPSDWPWNELSTMVISPGIPHHYPAPHAAVVMAGQHGVEVISDIELFIRARPNVTLVGITGTNGKSTVASLIKHILDYHGIATELGGNIGTPVLALNGDNTEVIVLELSSYQLETTPSLVSANGVFDVGAAVNITPDHLNRHGGWDGYVAAKSLLAQGIKPQGLLVLGDDDTAKNIAHHCRGTTHVIADTKPHLDANDMPDLTGPHNAINIAIAAKIVAVFGLGAVQVAAALPSFKGLPHRMEYLGAVDNGAIQFINDSKATNAAAAAVALKSYSQIYWIAGGDAKDDGLGVIADHLHAVRRAYLIGASANAFAHQLGASCCHEISETLEAATIAAVKGAKADAATGATILLSPAAASFDQFNSFEHRGDCFRTIVDGIVSNAPKPPLSETAHV